MSRRRVLSAMTLTGCSLLALTALCSGQPSPANRDLTTQQIAARALPDIVSLTVRDRAGSPAAFGSGVVVGKNLVVTCWHVVNGAHAVTSNFSDGRSENVPGTIAVDMAHDVALLSVPTGDVRPLRIASMPQLGASVVAIGNPEGFIGTLSTGIVSGLRTLESIDVIQTTAPISPGSSGGALLDVHGDVVGITEAVWKEGQNLNFAVSSLYVSRLLKNIRGAAISSWDTSSQAERQASLDEVLFDLWHYYEPGNYWKFDGIDKAIKALDHGANVNARKGGETALTHAAIMGSLDVMELYLDRGANVDARDSLGNTALINAAGSPQCDKVLLDHGADINAKNNLGATALMSAAVNGYLPGVKFLIAHGADVNIVSTDGRTALSVAQQYGHQDIVEVLKEAGETE